MCQLDKLQQLKPEILRLAHSHHAERVYIFGSCARKEESPESDVDVLADFSRQATLLDQCGLKVALEDLLHRNVDVISFGALKNDTFRHNVYRDMVELC